MSNINLNQFSMSMVQGALGTGAGSFPRVIEAQVSFNQATALVPGQAVKFDSAVTTGGIPSLLAAAQSDQADGYIIYTVKNGGNLTSGLVVPIMLSGSMWMTVGTAVNQGSAVEDASVAGEIEPVGTTGGAKRRGISLQNGAVGSLVIVNIEPIVMATAGL